jgi:hypothetical protein
MAIAFGTLEHYSHREQTSVRNVLSRVFGRMGEVLGCPHKEMSRPFSRQGETYRVCINCGARRGFDEKTWNSTGRYYFKPARMSDLQDIDTSAIRSV